MNKPGLLSSLGPSADNPDVESASLGFGQALNINVGAAGSGQNTMQIYVRRAICGNGIVDGVEDCDDKELNGTGVCSLTCTLP